MRFKLKVRKRTPNRKALQRYADLVMKTPEMKAAQIEAERAALDLLLYGSCEVRLPVKRSKE